MLAWRAPSPQLRLQHKLGMMVFIGIPVFRRHGQESPEFKTILDHIVSLRLVWATLRPCFKKGRKEGRREMEGGRGKEGRSQ